MKPATDQVLTNSSRCRACMAVWLSRSAMWMTRMPRSRANRPQNPGGRPLSTRCPLSAARLSRACLTKQDTKPGLAPCVRMAVGLDVALAQRQRLLAQGVVGALATATATDRYNRRPRARCKCPGTGPRVAGTGPSVPRLTPPPTGSTKNRRLPGGARAGRTSWPRSPPVAETARQIPAQYRCRWRQQPGSESAGLQCEVPQQQRQYRLPDAAKAKHQQTACQARIWTAGADTANAFKPPGAAAAPPRPRDCPRGTRCSP